VTTMHLTYTQGSIKKAGIALVLLVILSFFVNLKLILFFLFAIGFSILLAIGLMKISIPCDFELCTFSSVLGTAAFGIGFGIIISILSKIIPCVVRGKIIIDNLFQIVSYVIAGIIGLWLVGFWNITTAGIIAALIANILMYILSHHVLGVSPIDNLIYTGTNMIGNFLFFTIFAMPVFMVIK
jgi:hypothetical protein